MAERPKLGHFAVQVDDPEASAMFYTEFFGFSVVGRSSSPITGRMVLLTANRTEEDHVLQLLERREAEHVAFRVESLAELKAWHQEAKRKGIPIAMSANPGTQVGFFVKDPASGRFVEVYWPTGRTDIEASLTPIDLELPDEEILAAVRALGVTPRP